MVAQTWCQIVLWECIWNKCRCYILFNFFIFNTMGLFRSATCSQQQWPLIVGFPVLGLGLARCLLAEPEPVVTQIWHILSYPLNILRILSILSMWSCCTLADQGHAQERRRFLPNLEGAVSSVTGNGSGLWFWKQVHRVQNKSMSLHEFSNLLQ